MKKEKFITVLVNIKLDDIANLLCSAFEGGSNYWYMIVEQTQPEEYTFRTSKKQIFPHIDFPLNPGGSLKITTLEKDKIGGKRFWYLNLETIKDGMQTFLEDYPLHFADFVSGDSDAITGDVFLQCCLFGKVIYG